MFEVGDVVKVIGGRRGDRYRVISVEPNGKLILRNINRTDPSMNFTSNGKFDHLEIDKVYLRRRKLDNIRDNIESLYLMKRAKEMAELNRKLDWLLIMEQRKRKIKKICSKLVTK